MTPEVNLIDHPLISHKLTIMRDKNTGSGIFRTLLGEISTLLGYEVTRNLPIYQEEVETPLNQKTKLPVIKGSEVAFISILRAGNGMLDGMLQLIPSAHVGHIGLYREPKTLAAIEYYFKMPLNMSSKNAIIVDPMLATGYSAIAAVNRIKETNPKSLKFICLLAAPEGIEAFHLEHPDVPLYTAAIDDGLNEKKYIVPGLGDAGDRMFGTL